MSRNKSVWLSVALCGLVLTAALGGGAGCGAPTKLKMVPRIINVTATSSDQVSEDRKRIVLLLDDIATKQGLVKDERAPEGVLAAYSSPPSKLALSIAVVEEGDGLITTVAISPAALGLDLNSARKEFIDTVEEALKQAFGDRYKPAS